MKTELFIKIPTNETASLNNLSFLRSLEDWTIFAGTPTVTNAVCYLGATGIILQDYAISGGRYKITITVTGPEDQTALSGTLQVQVGTQLKEITTVGIHTFYLDVPNNPLFQYVSFTSVTFTGGFTNIIIEGLDYETTEVSLYDDITIPLTFSIADIADITSKNGSYSKTINLPGNTANNKLFKFIYDVSVNGTFIMNKSFPCFILSDTLTIFEGYFELTKVNISRGQIIDYEGFVYSEAVELFTKLGGKKLRGNDDTIDDLNFSDFDHLMTYNIVRQSGAASTKYTYRAIDKQGRSDSAYSQPLAFFVDELTPCLFIKDIWDRIFQKAGFTYESSFLNGSVFTKLLYPHTDRWLTLDNTETDKYTANLEKELTVEPDNFVKVIPATTLKPTVNDPAFRYNVDYVTWDVVSQGDYTPYTLYSYEAPKTGYYKIDINYNFKVDVIGGYSRSTDWELYTGECTVKIENRIKRNASIYYNQPDFYSLPDTITMIGGSTTGNGDINAVSAISSTFTVPEDIQLIFLNEGDILTHEVRLVLPFSDSAATWNGTSGVWLWKQFSSTGQNLQAVLQLTSDESTFSITRDPRIVENNLVPVTKILHENITQAEFVKSIIKMFNLYIEPIGNNKLKIEPRDSYFTTTAIDWSSKVDYSQPIEMVRASDIYDKIVIMKYDYDGTFKEEEYKNSEKLEYGQYYKKNINNKNPENTLEFIPIFAAAPTVNLGTSKLEVPCLYKTKDEKIDETAKLKPRILFGPGVRPSTPNGVQFVTRSRITSSQSISQQTYPYCGHLNFPSNLASIDINFFYNADTYYFDPQWTTWAPSNNIFSTYYYNMLTEISDTDSKLVTMSLILNQADIANFSFANNIFIDGNYYRVNKIESWVPDVPTRVELLTTKIQKLTYTVPPVVKPPKPPIVNKPFARKNEVYIDIVDSGVVSQTIKRNNFINTDLIDGNNDIRGTIFADVIECNNMYGDKRTFALSTNEMYIGVQSDKPTVEVPYLAESQPEELYFSPGYITNYYVL